MERRVKKLLQKKMRLLVYGGLFTALIVLATMFLKIPTLIGYANMGDGFALASATLLGPFAAIPAGLGSLLADLLLGYGLYAPATLVIKGAMGWMAGLWLKRGAGAFHPRNLLLFAGCELWMVAGYFGFECVLYGPAAALGSLVPNLLQGVVGIALGLTITPVLERLKGRMGL